MDPRARRLSHLGVCLVGLLQLPFWGMGPKNTPIPHCRKSESLHFHRAGHLQQAAALLYLPELARKWCFLQEKHFGLLLFSFSALISFFPRGGGELS